VKGVNLTDEEARQSTSILKDIAPLGGRGVIAGVRAEF
jgi:iron complex outermembrane recepter protein